MDSTAGPMVRKHRVCPASRAWLLDHPLRRIIHSPQRIVGPYIGPGDTVLDIGCASGFFTRPMAVMVGEEGCVIAADVQEEMLAMLAERAGRKGLLNRIRLHRTQPRSLDLAGLGPVDFALAFYVFHEVPDGERLMRDAAVALRPGGLMLVVEPHGEVTAAEFERTVRAAEAAGLTVAGTPGVLLSRTALLKKPVESGL
jgi:ubiquinone/menaquinone biosynthesis C-methylase UbiE